MQGFAWPVEIEPSMYRASQSPKTADPARFATGAGYGGSKRRMCELPAVDARSTFRSSEWSSVPEMGNHFTAAVEVTCLESVDRLRVGWP